MRVSLKETDLQILTDKPLDKAFVKERVSHYRSHIEEYIAKDRRFLTALKPLAVELHAPAIVKRMAEAARQANVGPMAAVAGALAEFLGRDLLKKGCKEVIIENGGDIFIATDRMRRIRIYAGRSKLWDNLRLEIKAKNTPLGICTSSGSIGHSLNFGSLDAAIILAKNASLADAVATATANRVKKKEDLKKAVDFAKSIKGISGAIAIIKNNLISWGRFELASSDKA